MKRPSKKQQKSTKSSAPKSSQRQKLLESILNEVPFEGWTEVAFEAGAHAAHMDPKTAIALFPNGISDVVAAFNNAIDQAMAKSISNARNFQRMKIREKVSFAVRIRLEYLTPHREVMKRLLMWYARPVHVASGVKELAHAADLIWQAAGDTSTDYNFYTKRLLLGVVMKTTLLYWLNDESKNAENTWEFLDRRLNEVVRVGKAINLAREWTPSEMMEIVRARMAGR